MPKILSSDTPETEFRTRPVKGVSLYIAEGTIAAMADHAEAGYLENKEVMGLLIGQILKDEEGTYVKVTDTATSDLDADEVSVRFKKEAIEDLFDSIDKCEGNAVVGWYHSHLGIGCFLSDVDIRTHLGIFGSEIGFAVVIDPSDSTFAAFYCSGGEQQKAPLIIME
ncbi:MAG: Mov34/MPN/PAD-1 family protein [Candidatus Methanoplasma sp.]|jgi:proteasome lid subunit RPN8/RPN11|nr:Mov34/MPN/PAD-1 family protein [Candidatus Methanoplasma sp.]